jgi:predicted TIM-barrel fold metal-dependent hydrolase
MGYFPADARLDPIFRICAEKNIPVLTHCGGESVSTFEREIEVVNENGRHTFKIPGDTRVMRARYLNNPEAWKPVLAKYPNLKINLAHFGGANFWQNHHDTGHTDPRIKTIIEMICDPKLNVYTDFSFNVVDGDVFPALKKEMDAVAQLKDRVMFGTDYWVVLPSGDLLEMQKEFLSHFTPYHKPMLNGVAMDYLLKQVATNAEN